MKRIMALLILISIAVLTGCSDGKTDSSKNLKILIDPVEQTIVQNQVAQFSLKIENVEDLFGVAVEISFDSTLVEIPENCLTSGEFWGNSVTFTQAISESGRLSMICSLFNGDQAINGSGELLKFSLRGIANGSSPITIYRLQLYKENGESVSGLYDIDIANGLLKIE